MSDRIVKPGTTSIGTTTLGFGGANLFRLPSAAERAKVLCATYDTGVTALTSRPYTAWVSRNPKSEASLAAESQWTPTAD
jgi:hypothetical protein